MQYALQFKTLYLMKSKKIYILNDHQKKKKKCYCYQLYDFSLKLNKKI